MLESFGEYGKKCGGEHDACGEADEEIGVFLGEECFFKENSESSEADEAY